MKALGETRPILHVNFEGKQERFEHFVSVRSPKPCLKTFPVMVW